MVPGMADDAFQAPESAPPTRLLATVAGLVMLGIAGVLALGLLLEVALGALGVFAFLEQPAGIVAHLIGVLWRAGVLAVLTAGFYVGGRGLLWPEAYGAEVHSRGVVRSIYDQERLGDRDDLGAPGDYYGPMAPSALADVYRNISRQAHPERFRQVLAAIKAAVETD